MSKTKIERLNQLIDSLDVCPKGREGVRELVSELTGLELKIKPKPAYRIGDRFKYRQHEYILAVHNTALQGDGMARVNAINLRRGTRVQGRASSVSSLYQITEHELVQIFGARSIAFITKIADSEIPASYMAATLTNDSSNDCRVPF